MLYDSGKRETDHARGGNAASALVEDFTTELASRVAASRALATRRMARRVALLTAGYALALLNGDVLIPTDTDGIAQALIADGNTSEELVLGASILFGLAVTHLGRVRAESSEAIANAANRAILIWLTPTMTAFGRLSSGPHAASLATSAAAASRLTRREREVLLALAATTRTSDLCQMLTISANTLRHHISKLCEKLGARNRYEALLIAQRLNLTT
ncbi:helix-turn-helix transcriptional regulator [Gryllotalpicola protaetiae]|uniref:Helix-turn-helix transcriptional regulator n=1 Tax=Gryllotalpicola protaetiae TaxID=2419771 RepID=A0A387BUY4_9MICO|nr:helix-turn-helix domain-containing protein [Gryllotalpicola protaetiae]AYG04687.1 helix-turn-helix transcriptional regulator [Gryllotalpicola protaetiae]